MKRPNQIAALVFLLISAFVIVESFRLQYYTPLGPGPGFFPFWLALLLGAMSALMLYHSVRHPSESMPANFFPDRSGYLRMVAIMVALAGVVLGLNVLGFRVTMLGFSLFLLFALGRQGLVVTGLVALGSSFGLYHLFVEWLDVPLPPGVLGF